MDKKRVSRFSVDIFLSHNAEKHRGRTLLCFRKVVVSKMFRIKGVSQFCQFFLSQIAKNHRGRTLLCFRILCFQNFLDNRGITSLSIVFVSECQKICGQPFKDSRKLGHPKLLCKIGDFLEFRSKKFSLTSPKNIVGEFLFCFKASRVSEIFMQKGGGGYYDSPSVYFLSQFPEKLRRGPFPVRKNFG